MTTPLLSVAITVPARLPADQAARITTMIERLGLTPVGPDTAPDTAPETGPNTDSYAAAVVVRANDPVAVATARRTVGEAGRVLVAVPISIGRTRGEASARADLEPRFTGGHDPRLSGIFGTFEEGQEQVLALARAGADGLVLDVPLERDVADVLAQIRALVVGATPRLRSAAPSGRSPVRPTVFYAEGWTDPEADVAGGTGA